MTCRKASGFTVPLTRSLMPPTSSISIEPASCAAGADVDGAGKLIAGDAVICTGTKPSSCRRLPVSPASLRQRNSKLLAMPCFLATADTGKCCVSSTARRRSSSDQRRRVSTTTILSLEICPDIDTEPFKRQHNHRLNNAPSIPFAKTKQGGSGWTLTASSRTLTLQKTCALGSSTLLRPIHHVCA